MSRIEKLGEMMPHWDTASGRMCARQVFKVCLACTRGVRVARSFPSGQVFFFFHPPPLPVLVLELVLVEVLVLVLCIQSLPTSARVSDLRNNELTALARAIQLSGVRVHGFTARLNFFFQDYFLKILGWSRMSPFSPTEAAAHIHLRMALPLLSHRISDIQVVIRL
eukprot:SAG31_NODE_1766_length_7315_cov_2.439302_4_plen_166_part_00